MTYNLERAVMRFARLAPNAPDNTRREDDWTSAALCQQFPPEMFDLDDKGANPSEAKKVCAICPVAVECLEDALRVEVHVSDVHGVRGGLSANERIKLKKQRRRAA